MRRRSTTLLQAVALACLAPMLTACGTTGDAQGPPSPTFAADATFVVSSTDFVDGGSLPESAKAHGFGGQCSGENLNPELSWTGAPAGTVAYAITLIDTSADNYVHWAKADIPAASTEVPAGGADALEGVGGRTGNSSGTYFGPCPPGPDHHYVFTVYALDATLGLDKNFGIGDLNAALRWHTLAQTSIAGLASPAP